MWLKSITFCVDHSERHSRFGQSPNPGAALAKQTSSPITNSVSNYVDVTIFEVSSTQILREINSEDFRSSTTAIFEASDTLNFVFGKFQP